MSNSKKKVFTLLYGDKLHIAPNTKIIPAAEFSEAVDAQDVMQKVQKEAFKYREEVVSESEKIKEQAYKEGYENGFAFWAEHVARLEETIKEVGNNFEKVLVPVATAAARKIVGNELSTREDTIVDIVAKTLKSVAQHKRITIYVNKKGFQALENNRPRLKDIFEDLQALSIRERDDIDDGGCVIETEGGIINAQLESQWLILEQAFQAILKGQDIQSAKQTSH